MSVSATTNRNGIIINNRFIMSYQQIHIKNHLFHCVMHNNTYMKNNFCRPQGTKPTCTTPIFLIAWRQVGGLADIEKALLLWSVFILVDPLDLGDTSQCNFNVKVSIDYESLLIAPVCVVKPERAKGIVLI